MTFLELICFSAASVAIFFIGYAVSHLNPLGWLIILPVLYFWLKMIGSIFRSLFYKKQGKGMTRPPCFKGKCQSKDYVLMETNGSNYIFQCRCGDRYLSQGTYFSRYAGDGSVQRYMVMQRNGAWVQDGVAPYPGV